MSYVYTTKGTCSTKIELELDGNVVHNVKFTGGCHGNLQAIPKLVEGLTVEEVEARMELIVEDLKSYDYTVSYGISHQDECSDIEPMIKEADSIMYERKEEYRKNNPSKYLVLKKAKE